MATATRFVPQCYRDSVSLMLFARRFGAHQGLTSASAQMATQANLALLKEAGILPSPPAPRPDDLLIVLEGEGDLSSLLDQAERELLSPETRASGDGEEDAPRLSSLDEALRQDNTLDFALISVPGDYAAGEAHKALARGLDVMLFSDNVSLEDEVELKAYADRQGKLLLGPDCGSAILDGAPLGFANQVRRGPIGIVSASGTGLQEVTCLVDRYGLGISQAYGTGGRDLKEEVGGRAALACLDRLELDRETRCIVFISKPPGKAVKERLLERFRASRVPVVPCFLGEGTTLEDAARLAYRTVAGRDPPPEMPREPRAPKDLAQRKKGFVRGVYSGGTLCAEAAWLFARAGLETHSNVRAPMVLPLEDPWRSVGHAFIDLGEDEFTRGRPHPMIDPTLRTARLAFEAEKEDTFLLLADVVLGHGAHQDPAGALSEAVLSMEERRVGPSPLFFANVVGTENDPQGLERSLERLASAGIRSFTSNAAMVKAALEALP